MDDNRISFQEWARSWYKKDENDWFDELSARTQNDMEQDLRSMILTKISYIMGKDYGNYVLYSKMDMDSIDDGLRAYRENIEKKEDKIKKREEDIKKMIKKTGLYRTDKEIQNEFDERKKRYRNSDLENGCTIEDEKIYKSILEVYKLEKSINTITMTWYKYPGGIGKRFDFLTQREIEFFEYVLTSFPREERGYLHSLQKGTFEEIPLEIREDLVNLIAALMEDEESQFMDIDFDEVKMRLLQPQLFRIHQKIEYLLETGPLEVEQEEVEKYQIVESILDMNIQKYNQLVEEEDVDLKKRIIELGLELEKSNKKINCNKDKM